MAGSSAPKRLLGYRLMEKGLITAEQLREALRVQSRTGEKLGRVLVRLGMVEEEVIAGFLNTGRAEISTLDPALLKLIPEQVVRRCKALPLKKEEGRLVVAMADPADLAAVDDIRFFAGCDIEPVPTAEEEIEAAIQRYYGMVDFNEVLKDYEGRQERAGFETHHLPENGPAYEAPVVRLVNSLLQQAIEQNASDIHIEPGERRVRVRFRVDGLLREVTGLPSHAGPPVVSRVKIMAGMDIADRRVPQDGRVKIRQGGQEVNLRVSTMPTAYGEKAVIRLLPRSAETTFRVERLALQQANYLKFINALRASCGIILITGPTGSGKTTTLYAALNELNTVEKNIVTVEDPVEYVLEGINQTQVNPRAGVTFASALRSLLRQDPDIIMVGEIRDAETARTAVRAAATGHLVLSTLHTNDAAGAVVRLLDMGVEPYLVASSLLLVLGQRLVRTICQDCRVSYEIPECFPWRASMGINPAEKVLLYRGEGCSRCGNTGYRGRIPVHEVLSVTPEIRFLVHSGASAAQIKEKAVAGGMITLWEDGMARVREGLTTIEEIMRVVHNDVVEF